MQPIDGFAWVVGVCRCLRAASAMSRSPSALRLECIYRRDGTEAVARTQGFWWMHVGPGTGCDWTPGAPRLNVAPSLVGGGG
jgi:hypothetical protein